MPDQTHLLSYCLGLAPQHFIQFKMYVANRINEIVSRVPAKQWRWYVATDCNPADCASRGLLPKELVEKSLWDGPPWLRQSPDQWPHRPDLTPSEELSDLRGAILVISSDSLDLCKRFSSFTKLQRVLAWCFCFYSKTPKFKCGYQASSYTQQEVSPC